MKGIIESLRRGEGDSNKVANLMSQFAYLTSQNNDFCTNCSLSHLRFNILKHLFDVLYENNAK